MTMLTHTRRWTGLLWMLVALPIAVRAVEISEIEVINRGSGVVDPESVLSFISSREGAELDRTMVARDVKRLQESGRFAYVGVEVEAGIEDVTLIYVVERKNRLRTLTFEGEYALRENKIRSILGLNVGQFVEDAELTVAARRLEQEYRERYYYDATVSWKQEVDERNASTDVTFQMDEGPRVKMRDISFEGNRTVKAKVLKKTMQQKEWWIFSFFTKSGRYRPGDLDRDREAIRGVYLDRGYLDVSVGEPRISVEDNQWVDAEIPIDEGRVYLVGDVQIEGNSIFEKDRLLGQVSIQPGTIAGTGSIEESRQAVEDYYGSRGYLGTRVLPDRVPNTEEGTVSVLYRILEGELAYIRNINIRGNERTKDKVIRRELVVYPGEVYNQVKIRTSESRVRNLNYFNTVTTAPSATPDPNEYDLNLEVQEKRTGQFVVGFGFSSIDDLIGFVEVSQGNFDLLGWPNLTGGGQKIRLRSQFGTERRDFELSFVEPWFLDRKLSLQLDLFQSDREFLSDDYEQKNTGARIGLGRAVSRFNRLNLTYSIEEIEVTDISATASDIIKAEEGDRMKSALTAQLLHDSRDSFFVSTRGHRSSISLEVAGGVLGADTDLYKLEARTSHYIPLWFDHVLNLRGWAASVEEYGDSDRVPIFDRLFLGGARTLRGFEFRDVGPKDETGEPVGGKTGGFATAEYTIPVATSVRVAGFYDIGMVWADAFDPDFGDLNSDAGIGVRLDIPGFPLRFDYAWPLEADEFNDRSSGRFNFLIGYVF